MANRRAILTVTKPLPGALIERLTSASTQLTVSTLYEDKEAEEFLRNGISKAEKELDGMGAKLGMKQKTEGETSYGFSFNDCWYQRAYR